MNIFLDINKSNREKLFGDVKERYKKSWGSIAKESMISRSMLFYYKNGKFPLPKQVFDKLISGSKIDVSYKELNKNLKFLEKEIVAPKINEEVAEVLGAINGDGHINAKSYEVSITGSKYDKHYFDYLNILLERQFNIRFKLILQDTRIRLKTYSKKLALLLNREYNAPLGKKTGNLQIPVKLKNKKLIMAYLRGLFDTDGSIYIRRKKEVVLEIISADKNFLNQIKDSLLNLGLKAGISGKNLYIYKKEDIIKFFELIRPSNDKHLKKYNLYYNLCAGGPMAKSS